MKSTIDRKLRRQRVKTVVVDKYRYKPLCDEPSSLTENLSGDELVKKIKTLDKMQKVGKGVIKKQWKRKHKNQDNSDRPPNSRNPIITVREDTERTVHIF